MIYFLWLTDQQLWPNATVIDSLIQSGIMKTDICDHLVVYSLIETNL